MHNSRFDKIQLNSGKMNRLHICTSGVNGLLNHCVDTDLIVELLLWTKIEISQLKDGPKYMLVCRLLFLHEVHNFVSFIRGFLVKNTTIQQLFSFNLKHRQVTLNH